MVIAADHVTTTVFKVPTTEIKHILVPSQCTHLKLLNSFKNTVVAGTVEQNYERGGA